MKLNKMLIIALVVIFSGSVFAQVAVIANKSVSDASLDSKKVEEIYSLKLKTWSDGKSITLFAYKSDNGTVEKFYSSMGKSSSDMKKLWMKLQLTGEGTAPEALGSEDEVLNKVASTPGAIGFVDASKVNGNVKVLLTIN